MMFSSKSEYGVRVMVELARRTRAHGTAVVSLAEIAERNQMPLAYLEQLMARLRKAGLVDSRRGARGGYLLARPAAQITMAEIIEALEGSIAPVECISLAADGTIVCSREADAAHVCPTKLLWTRVRFSIVRTLMETTLGDLIGALARPIGVAELENAVTTDPRGQSSLESATAEPQSLAADALESQPLTTGA
jgi:Rrf2 family transcriptional regulator, cysteine metabolism repressor